MATLDGIGRPVVLAPGVILTAPGLQGQAELRPAPTGGRGRQPEETPTFAEAIARAGMVESHSIEIRAQEPGPEAGPQLRSRDGRAGLSLEVPYLGPERGQVLLLADEQGVLSWHFPEPPAVTGTSRGAATVRFVIPREVAQAPPAGGAELPPADRSLVTLIGKKVLSVLVYPIARELIGKGAQFLAQRWEAEHRPHVVRAFGLDAYRAPAASGLEPEAWGHLGAGRALLFVHGTFSTAHGSFAGLPTETMTALATAYEGRVIAFDHPSLSVDPMTNAKTLLDLVPAGAQLDVDVVGHSRGGLVARHLPGLAGPEGLASLRIGRVVVVGTPNAGTPLADPKHMGQLVDRFTSLLNLIPPGPWSAVLDVLEAVIEVVKIVGQGALEGLPGLAAMNPSGTYLRRLQTPAPAEVFAIDADFEPTGSLASLWRLPETAVDRVFSDDANDAVVPSEGVWNATASGLTVPQDRCVHVPADAGVWHCSYFSRPEVSNALLSWLRG